MLAELTFKILNVAEFAELWIYGLTDDLQNAKLLEDMIRIPLLITNIHRIDDGIIPAKFSLKQNYPNPFNMETEIVYELARTTEVALMIYNAMGQKVKTLVSEKQNAGRYVAHWSGKDDFGNDLPSGIYVCKLETVEFVDAKKLILVR